MTKRPALAACAVALATLLGTLRAEGTGIEEPVAVTGKAIPAERLEEAARAGVAYILSRQAEGGCWSSLFSPQELKGEGLRAAERPMASTWCVTALCCMALRAHPGAAPADQVDQAVAKGVRYLLDGEGACRKTGKGAPWTWIYCLDFLCAEYPRTRDGALRDEILGEVRRLATTLCAAEGPMRADYGAWGGDGVSFLTADALLALDRARGIGVDIPGKAVEDGLRGLERARAEQGGDQWYGYAECSKGPLRMAMGRTCVCELGLLRWGKRSQEDLARALRLFLAHRQDLDRARGCLTHNPRAFGNAGYFFLYGYWHAAEAANAVSDRALAADVKAAVREVMLATRQANGTWRNPQRKGDLHTTALALLALAEAIRAEEGNTR